MSHPDYAHIGHTTDLMTEECAELIQAVAKARRFGLFGFHPETLVSNIDHIRAEMDDVERPEFSRREAVGWNERLEL